ncbi:MAG: ACP S-malonyltransferase [Thiotrichales bacterium]
MSFAVVFPGQGSQSVGMLSGLADTHPIVRQTFEEASDILSLDLWKLSQEGPESGLNATENTQPIMLAAGIAVCRVWVSHGGPAPVTLAGHSLGEYSALVAADAIALTDAISLVHERGRLMQAAVAEGEGAMAAILGMADDAVMSLCDQASQGDVLSAVNFNSPGQVVIAGTAPAVDRAISLAKEAGAKRALKLAVSVPSHCALMKPAADALSERMESVEIKPPSIPVIHNVDVDVHQNPDEIKKALSRQLYSPVRWVETVERLKQAGMTRVFEFGPGKVLTGLGKRIDKSLLSLCVMDDASLETALEEVDA